MQCHEFDERLHRLLDDRQSPQRDGALLAHAQYCASCREVLRAQESLLRHFGRNCTPQPPPGFPSRFLERADVAATLARREKPSRRWLLVATIGATAALALMAVTLAMLARPPRPGTLPTVVDIERRALEPANEPGSGLAADEPSRPQIEQPRNSSSPVPQQLVAADKTDATLDSQSIEQYGQVLQSIASRVPEAVDRLDEVEQATPGLRPVRASFTLAIGTIRRTIPPRPKRAPPKPSKSDSGMVSGDSCWLV